MTVGYGQLTLDGREVPHPGPDRPRMTAPLNATQREILRVISDRGYITSSHAGVLVHLARDGGQGRCRRMLSMKGDEPRCCQWAASDGGDAMKRLMARGFVRRSGGGWESVHA